MLQTSSRFSFSSIKRQLIEIMPTIGVGVLVSLGGAGFTVLVSKLTGSPIWKLAKDPAQVMNFPPYIGMLSNWAIMLWIATAAICLFGAVVLKKQNASYETRRFVTISGFLSLLLGIDDLYLFHDQVLPRMLHIREGFFYMIYMLIFLAYLLMFAAQILKYDYLLFGASFFLLVASRRVIVFIPFLSKFMTTADMLKYFGIVFWLAFFYRVVLQEVSARIPAS